MRALIFAALVAATPAAAQAVPHSQPQGGNVAVTTSPTVMIPAYSANASVYALRYQVQGAGYACVSWVTSVITISANTASAQCGGAGAFLVTAASTDARVTPSSLPTTALYGIAATGASLSLSYEVE